MKARNEEHYHDPTARDAINNIDNEIKRQIIRLVIPGEPIAQGRPRFVKQGNFTHAYDPKKSKDYKAKIASAAWVQLSQHEIKQMNDAVPLYVTIVVYREIPKSWSKKKQEDAANGKLRPVSRPDTDNYIKIALDALNKVVFKDDSAVVSIRAEKYYSTTPRMEITIQYAAPEVADDSNGIKHKRKNQENS